MRDNLSTDTTTDNVKEHKYKYIYTVKPVHNDHPRDPKIVVVVDRMSLFRGHLCYINQRSHACGPGEGPMWPANIGKN